MAGAEGEGMAGFQDRGIFGEAGSINNGKSELNASAGTAPYAQNAGPAASGVMA